VSRRVASHGSELFSARTQEVPRIGFPAYYYDVGHHRPVRLHVGRRFLHRDRRQGLIQRGSCCMDDSIRKGSDIIGPAVTGRDTFFYMLLVIDSFGKKANY
jgi:hypothetical protein